MALALQTSDYVSILGAAAQILTTVAVAVWTVRKTVSAKAPASSSSRSNSRTLLALWVRATWAFLLFGLLGLATTVHLILGEEPLSKAFVVQLVLATLYTTLNLLGSLVALFYLIQNRVNELSLKHMEGTDKVLAALLSMQRETIQSHAKLSSTPASTASGNKGTEHQRQ